MSQSVIKAVTLVTEDGVPLDAVHLPGPLPGPAGPGGGDTGGDAGDLGIVIAHGFTLNWQRPAVWDVAARLRRFGGVITFDFRGHGRSGGVSTLGDLEIKDLDAAVAWARELGYRRVVTVGFSMGASIVLRHAALIGGADAVVSVSGPGRWYYRGTKAMRRVHFAIEHRVGRFVARNYLNTRIGGGRWEPVPMPPAQAAGLIAPVPLLIVHGDRDLFFPVDHAEQLYAGARDPKELWIVPGFGHAESAAGPDLLDRIGGWLRTAVAIPAAASPNAVA
jgi:pimeloyl-ACP methyl ester carboxylesterase